MPDIDLIYAIAGHLGFDPNFSCAFVYDELVIWDAECDKVPNYIKILGRTGAENLLTMLTAIKAATEQI